MLIQYLNSSFREKNAQNNNNVQNDETITFTIKLSIATSKLIKVHTYNAAIAVTTNEIKYQK